MIQQSRSPLPFGEQSFATDSNWIQIENLDQNARSICMSLEEFIPSVQRLPSGGKG